MSLHYPTPSLLHHLRSQPDFPRLVQSQHALFRYLNNTPAAGLDERQMVQVTKRLRKMEKAQLSKAEILQIVNLVPRKEWEVNLILEQHEARNIEEEDIQEILQIVQEECTAAIAKYDAQVQKRKEERRTEDRDGEQNIEAVEEEEVDDEEDVIKIEDAHNTKRRRTDLPSQHDIVTDELIHQNQYEADVAEEYEKIDPDE